MLGAAAMSHAQQDLAAATAPFDSRLNGVGVLALAQGQPSAASVTGGADEPREIQVVAKKFAFEPSRIEVTEGERVRLVVTSADILHGVEIKKFRVKKTVPRGGTVVTIEFTASAAGEYPILCSEYCGQGHDDMKGTLIVSAAKPNSPAPARGMDETTSTVHDRPNRSRHRLR